MALKISDDLKKLICDTLYPVGSIYMCDNNTNPSSKFGGTWVIVPAGHLYSQSNGGTLMQTGGSTTTGSTAITVAQMGKHRHHVRQANTNDPYSGPDFAGYYSDQSPLGGNYHFGRVGTAGPGAVPRYVFVDEMGSNQSHTHSFQPTYVTVRCWRRTVL